MCYRYDEPSVFPSVRTMGCLGCKQVLWCLTKNRLYEGMKSKHFLYSVNKLVPLDSFRFNLLPNPHSHVRLFAGLVDGLANYQASNRPAAPARGPGRAT